MLLALWSPSRMGFVLLTRHRAAAGKVPYAARSHRGIGHGQSAVGGGCAFARGVAKIDRRLRAVVRAGFEEIDFLAGVLADVAHPQVAGLPIDAHAESVARARGVDFAQRRAVIGRGRIAAGVGEVRARELLCCRMIGVPQRNGVGGRNGEVFIGVRRIGVGVALVDIHAQHFAQHTVGFLLRPGLGMPLNRHRRR